MAKVVNSPGRTVGLRNVGSYQISGHPYITGSTNMGSACTTMHVKFPHVAKNFTVIASGSSQVNIHFNPTSAGRINEGNHFVTLSGSATNHRPEVTFDVKCKEVFITNITANAGFQLYASLTGIPFDQMYVLTGSGLTD
tara:strand:+ start:1210 stop:1626 length:417 start_codon:yes stop_codon:yes gene_type:complete